MSDLTPEDEEPLVSYLWQIDSWYTMEEAIMENERNLELCQNYGCKYVLIRENYEKEMKESLLFGI